MSEKIEHTPGPWNFRNSRDAANLICIEPYIAWVDKRHNVKGEANGKLIAAAPDLLAACEAALDCLTPTGSDTKSDRAITQLQEAIRKAEGQQPETKSKKLEKQIFMSETTEAEVCNETSDEIEFMKAQLMAHLEPTKTRLAPAPTMKDESQQEIQDLINNTKVVPSADAINRLLVICEKLNGRISKLENFQKRMAAIASALANGIQPD